MFRRMLTWLVCVGCIIVWSMPVKAVQKGTIKVKTTGGTVALYKIGQINGQSFCLYPEYGQRLRRTPALYDPPGRIKRPPCRKNSGKMPFWEFAGDYTGR